MKKRHWKRLETALMREKLKSVAEAIFNKILKTLE